MLGYQIMTQSTNYFIIISWTTHMGSATYENTQLTHPGQPPAFTVIQVSRRDNYTLDWCVRATRLREMESENNEMCVTGPRSWFER